MGLEALKGELLISSVLFMGVLSCHVELMAAGCVRMNKVALHVMLFAFYQRKQWFCLFCNSLAVIFAL